MDRKKGERLIGLLVVVFLLFGCGGSKLPYKDVTEKYFSTITSESSTWNMITFQKTLDIIGSSPQSVFIVDIRGQEDYGKGHLPGAVHIPYGKFGEQLDVFPKNKKVLVYCFSGQTSGQAVSALKSLGFDALSIQGGMNFGWAPLGLDPSTLETKVNPLPAGNNYTWSDSEKKLIETIKTFFANGNYIVQPAAVNDLIRKDPLAIYILDLRNEAAFNEARIERSVLIPFMEVSKKLSEIPTNRPVYIACFSGQTAGQALFQLRINGIEAYSVSRGMIGWNGANMPVVGGGDGDGTSGGCE